MKTKALQLVEFQITWEPLPDPEWEELPEAVRDRLLLIYRESSQRSNAGVLPELEAAYKAHPNVPTIGNWLSMAYAIAGRKDAALDITRAILSRRPDYLFARVGLAHAALERGCLEEARELLGSAMFLPSLYPERKIFHISEILAHTFAAANYHLLTADFAAAESKLDLMKQLEPQHRLTNALKGLLTPKSRERFRFLASLQTLICEPRKPAAKTPRKKPPQSRRTRTNSAQRELELPF